MNIETGAIYHTNSTNIIENDNVIDSVEIYCKLIPDWIESTQARILFNAQYRKKF